MTIAIAQTEFRRPWNLWHGLWVAAMLVTLGLYEMQGALPWLDTYPKAWLVPFSSWTNDIMGWVFGTFFTLTRAVTATLNVPLQLAYGLLERGFTIGDSASGIALPPLSWAGIVAVAAITGYAYGGWRLAALGGLGFFYLAEFNQWTSAMRTLALIVNAVPLGVAIGLALGIAGHRSPAANRWLIVPLLDLAQAMPAYAYLVPMLILFGNNPVSAMLSILIYATPPMVRATTLALHRVPGEVRDFGNMAGCTRRQLLWRILVPSARPLLMVGVNQVIMAALNMVIIASMIGAGGLGYDVLLALRGGLKVGIALQAGIAIVLLAIVFDRLSKAIAAQKPTMYVPGQSFRQRHPYLVAAAVVLAATTLLGLIVPELAVLPKSATLTTGSWLDQQITAFNKAAYDYINAVRVFLVLYILKPFKHFLLALPWLAVVPMLGLAGLQLGGWRLALLVMLLTLFCVVSGLWEPTVVTVYLVSISTLFASLIGIPLGILAARNDSADRILTVVIDTLQTIPAFNYLIPAVILLGVGDVAAMLGIVLYSMTCAVRYTNHGIRQVSPNLIEAAKVSGCTRHQLLWRVQLPLALPEIMLGINQVIMFALAMDIIAAMIGTDDLGQEVFKALAKADAGRGLIGGLAVACIGIVADRLISAWSQRVKERFGLA